MPASTNNATHTKRRLSQQSTMQQQENVQDIVIDPYQDDCLSDQDLVSAMIDFEKWQRQQQQQLLQQQQQQNHHLTDNSKHQDICNNPYKKRKLMTDNRSRHDASNFQKGKLNYGQTSAMAMTAAGVTATAGTKSTPTRASTLSSKTETPSKDDRNTSIVSQEEAAATISPECREATRHGRYYDSAAAAGTLPSTSPTKAFKSLTITTTSINRTSNTSNTKTTTTTTSNYDSSSSSNNNTANMSLTQMVDEDDENDGYDDKVVDPDLKRLRTNCLELRTKLEKFVKKLFSSSSCVANTTSSFFMSTKKQHLMQMIGILQARGIISAEFAASMHQIRHLGNQAAHHDENLPCRRLVEQVVRNYLQLKQTFEQTQKQRRHRR